MKIDTVILSIFLIFIIVSSSVVAIPENEVFGSYPLIYKVYPNPYTKGEGDEFISIINPIDRTVNLNGYSITDLEGEIFFPPFSIPPGKTCYWAYSSEEFKKSFGFYPDFSYIVDTNSKTKMIDGRIKLANTGDEVVLKKGGKIVDALVYGDSDYREGWASKPVKKPREGQILKRNSFKDHDNREDWESPKETYCGQTNFRPEEFKFKGKVIAFTSPDSSFLTLTELIEKAEERIYIYTYTVENLALAPFLKDASKRGVEIKVLVEGSPAGGMGEDEPRFLSYIKDLGGGVGLTKDPYVFNHQKFAILDDVTVVTSENMGYSGLPVDNRYGNRGFWIAICDKDVSAYYLKVFLNDWNHASSFEEENLSSFGLEREYVPIGRYTPKFESKIFDGEFTVFPVIGPDFSIEDNPLIDAIENANDKILVEIFYADLLWRENPLLNGLINAAKRGVNVYILLDSSDYNVEPDKIDNDDFVRYIEELGEDFPIHAEIIEKKGLLKLHNKSMIIDDAVFVSSFNWNYNSFMRNREAGVVVYNKELARYYEDIFWHDWGKGKIERGTLIMILCLIVAFVSFLVARRFKRS